MTNQPVKALVLAGYGINCDHETQYALSVTGAEADRVHINRLIEWTREGRGLSEYHILAVDGGFAWADDHGAGVLLGLKMQAHLGDHIQEFIRSGRLIIGICNGFQALVNMGLLPGFDGDYRARQVALAANDCNNYRDQWVRLAVDPSTRCVFTRGMETLDLPVRHGEGKFYAPDEVIDRLKRSGQVVMRYCSAVESPRRKGDAASPPEPPAYTPARGAFPDNPNGSLDDIAGICDETGRVFGLMPHPEGYHHLINHPDWTRRLDHPRRWGRDLPDWEGPGLKIFRNAVAYVRENLL